MRIERAKPLLGTIVSIRADFDDPAPAEAAVRSAFAEIAAVHGLMSFHEPGSDLSRIHAAPTGGWVGVDARTAEVLAFVVRLAEDSGGVFDPVAAARTAVAGGALPRPAAGLEATPGGTWRDLELDGDGVRLGRPGWIDLGGVAKGYAVDRAAELLMAAGVRQATVNAGGDLRVCGPDAEQVRLRAPGGEAMVEIRGGALASSGWAPGELLSIHLDPRTGRAVDRRRFVAVTAADCITADALTKVALASGERAGPLLALRGADAHLFDGREWSRVARAA